MAQLKIHLLGAFQATVDGEPVIQFEAATARGLLAYLVMQREQPQAREALATLLWQEDSGATGLTNLRSALRRVRNALHEEVGATTPFLLVSRDTVQCNPQAECWVDVYVFEELLAQVKGHAHRRLQACPWCMARLNQAASLYRGPFLSYLQVDSIAFEEWQRLNHERLHRLAMQSLFVLTEFHMSRGNYTEAEQYARRQLTLECWNEEAHQQLMRILYGSGQRSAALAQYENCRTILNDELNVPPLPETVALYEEIRSSPRKGKEASWLSSVNAEGKATAQCGGASSLPQYATPFIARESEVDLLLHQLVQPANRVVTVTGEGGVGKTRLAVAAATALLGSFRDGVWYVSLAGLEASVDEVRLHDAVAGVIVETVRLSLSNSKPPRMEAPALLRDKEMLLVLDNFEHLLPAAVWLKHLLHEAPNMTILVTSRQRLDLQCEFVLRLDGLPVSGEGASDVQGQSAIQLFILRAQQCWPSFRLQRVDIPAVVQICRILRGLPLGIELAAGLVNQMTPAEIASALSDGLDLLTTTQPDAPPRQRSMRAVFAYSWQLLSDEERSVLAALTVFRGGFQREAAVDISGAAPLTLARLYEKVLLQQDVAGRYELHELLRQFVEEQTQRVFLTSTLASISRRHCVYYLAMLRRHERDLRGHRIDQALALIRGEFDNIRRAWRWAVENQAWDLIADTVADLRYVCHLLGFWQEGEHLLTEAEARLVAELAPCRATATLAKVRIEVAEIHLARGDYSAVAEIARHLTKVGRSDGLDSLRASGHLLHGKAYKEQGHLVQARRRLTLVLALAQRAGAAHLKAEALYHLGGVAHAQGEKARSHVWIEQALALYRQLGDRLEEANALCALSQIYHNDPGKVYQLTTERLALARRVGSAVDEFRSLHRLALLWLNIGEYERACNCCQQALALAERLNSPRYAALVLDFLALAHHYQGDDLAALRYLEQAVQLCTATGDQRGLAYAFHWKGQVLLARNEPTNAASCYARAIDIRLLYGQPHMACHSQAGLARVRLAQGRVDLAYALIEPIVAQLDELRRKDVEDPCILWHNCFLALRANHDRRAAAVLDQAYAILQERAVCISDVAMRHTFLHSVVVNRQIVAEWQAAQARRSHIAIAAPKINGSDIRRPPEGDAAALGVYPLPPAMQVQIPAPG